MQQIFRPTLLSVLLLAGGISATAQTADWKVSPRFDNIIQISPTLYQVKQGYKTGLIDREGTLKFTPEEGEITPFYEGLALIYDRQPEGLLLRGIISENGNIIKPDGRYYLFPEYPFFSEGFLPVRNSSGLQGYLTPDCRPAFQFMREDIHPFSEGTAAIGAGEDFAMINAYGEKMYIALPGGDYAFGGTNYYNGKCLVWDDDWKCYILDDSGRFESLGRQDLSQIRVDYLYRFGSGKGSNIPSATFNASAERTWQPVSHDGLWTFRNSGGKLLTPYRYDRVKEFSNGVAIASMDGKYGLLEIVEDNSTFASWTNKSEFSYSPGNSVKCEFYISIPQKWRNQDLKIDLKDSSSGIVIPYERRGNSFIFNYQPEGNANHESKSVAINISHAGAPLWKGIETYEFNKVQKPKVRLQAAIRLNNADANSSDQCVVTATLRNPGDTPITTTVHLTGGGNKASFSNKTLTVTVPAYGTKSVSGSFTVKKVELNGWCAVSTSDGASAKRSGLQLKPF